MEELLAVMNPRRKRRTPPRGRGGRFVSRRARRNPSANPRRRRGGRKRARRNPFVAGLGAANPRRRYRRNPRPLGGALMRDMTAALTGAAGGIALDLVMRPLPTAWKVGAMSHLVRGAGAIGIGMLGGMARGQVARFASDMARGALTITVYNAARQYVTVPMGLGELTDDEVAQVLSPSPTVYDDLPMLEEYTGTNMSGVGMYDEMLEDM